MILFYCTAQNNIGEKAQLVESYQNKQDKKNSYLCELVLKQKFICFNYLKFYGK